MAVHSMVRRTGHQNDNLEESIKALLMDLRDQRERHVGLQISQHEVEIQTRLGTVWVHRKGEIETQPRSETQEKPKGNDLDIEMAIEGLTLRDPDLLSGLGPHYMVRYTRAIPTWIATFEWNTSWNMQ